MDGKQKLRELAKRKSSMSFQNVPSKTEQHYRDGTRVDSILKKYATLGVDSNNIGLFRAGSAKMPYGQETPLTFDYQGQLNAVVKVNAYFDSLPSRMRDMFHHNPAEMLAFMANPKNAEECKKLGLFETTPGSGRKPEETPAPKKGEETNVSSPQKT